MFKNVNLQIPAGVFLILIGIALAVWTPHKIWAGFCISIAIFLFSTPNRISYVFLGIAVILVLIALFSCAA